MRQFLAVVTEAMNPGDGERSIVTGDIARYVDILKPWEDAGISDVIYYFNSVRLRPDRDAAGNRAIRPNRVMPKFAGAKTAAVGP